MPHTTHLTNRPHPPEPRTPRAVARWCWATILWAAGVLILSVKHPRQAARNFWHLVNEPRGITLLVFAGYVVLTWGGQSALRNPPNTVENAAGELAMTLLSTMFVSGGVIGALTCLPGWNWLERGGVLLAGFAALIYASIAISLGVTTNGNRDLQVSLILFAVIMLTGRAFWIWERPYAKRRDKSTATTA